MNELIDEPEEYVHCECNAKHLPLWSYCGDDLFCPLCGTPVAQLKSNEQVVSGGKTLLLIYGESLPEQRVPRFAFPLDLVHTDVDRSKKTRSPVVTGGTLAANHWFQSKIEVEQVKAGFQFFCRLTPAIKLTPGIKPPPFRLPRDGLQTKVNLTGDFGSLDLPLCVCNFPEIQVELTGVGIDEAGPNCWQVWRSELLDLTFTLSSRAAPVTLDEDLLKIGVLDEETVSLGIQPITAVLQTPLRKGTQITPGQPWSSKLSLDCSRFGTGGKTCQLLIEIHLQGIDFADPLVLTLEYVDNGRIAFTPVSSLTIKEMYVGESHSNESKGNVDAKLVVPKWYITNVGKQEIRVARPVVVSSPNEPQSIDWARVNWAPDADDTCVKPAIDGTVSLPPGGHAAVFVQADLSRVAETVIPDGTPLFVNVSVTDERNIPWPTRIHINSVRHRRKSPYPLAIDFGNSHSFAAMWTPDSLKSPNNVEISPVHDLELPDTFPTAIYFDDVSNRDYPEYSIGHEAIRKGAKNPEGLVTDLKRWIGQGHAHHQRTVIDSKLKNQQYDIATLVVFFIRALIQRSENIIRKYRISEISLSYPATFGPKRSRAMEQILTRLQNEVRGHKLKLVADGMAIDEANAAIISYVLSRDCLIQQQSFLNRGKFIAAAVDWGGGSLDTAVLRFTVKNQKSYPLFTSDYLGIGGDEFFGGDNMTLAVMELVGARFRKTLPSLFANAAHWERLVPKPHLKDSSNQIQRMNFEALWNASEIIKRFQSIHWDQAAPEMELKSLHRKLNHLLADRFDFSSLFSHLPGLVDTQESEREKLRMAVIANEFLIDIKAAWTHPIQSDFQGDGHYTIQERFKSHLEQLKDFARRKPQHDESSEIDLLILCGSGSLLPLVRHLAETEFDAERIISVPEDAKRRVAHGIVRYLDARKVGHALARSKDYTNADIGLLMPGFRGGVIPIVAACTSVVDKQARHPILNRSGSLESMQRYFQEEQLTLYRQQTPHPWEIGYFDLRLPPSNGIALPDEAYLDDDEEDNDQNGLLSNPRLTGFLKLNGSEQAAELYVEYNSAVYGPWHLQKNEEIDD